MTTQAGQSIPPYPRAPYPKLTEDKFSNWD